MVKRIITFRASQAEWEALNWLVEHGNHRSGSSALRKALLGMCRNVGGFPDALLVKIQDTYIRSTSSRLRRQLNTLPPPTVESTEVNLTKLVEMSADAEAVAVLERAQQQLLDQHKEQHGPSPAKRRRGRPLAIDAPAEFPASKRSRPAKRKAKKTKESVEHAPPANGQQKRKKGKVARG
jgi:hypothetical protein